MEIKGSLGVNKSQLINLLGSKMYRSDVQNVAVKELIQNAFDAVKIAKALGKITDPRIDVVINTWDRKVTVSDNGIGMTPDIVQRAFFTIGGSDKGGVDNRLRSGGLGLAKMAFLFSSERISLITRRDGIETTVDTTPEEIQTDSFYIRTSPTTLPNGTEVTVKIPENYINENGEKNWIGFYQTPEFLKFPLVYDGLTLRVNNDVIKCSWIPDKYAYLGSAKSAFGDIDIFVKPSVYKSSTIDADVYISGLRQFRRNVYLNGNDKENVSVLLNILPSVDTSSRVYPINNTREGFNAAIEPEVKDIEWLVKKVNNLMSKRKAREMFANKIASSSRVVSDVKAEYDPDSIFNDAIRQVQSAFTTTETYNGRAQNVISLEVIHKVKEAEEKRESSMDFSGINLDAFEVAPIDTSAFDINKPIFHNNTNMIIEADGQKVMDDIGELLLQLKKLYMDVYGENDKLNNQYWGISLDKRYIGIHVKASIINMLAINPFLGMKIRNNTNPIEARTEAIVHEIMHEFTHNSRSWHDASFCAEMLCTYAAFAGIGKSFIEWKDRLRSLIRENFQTIAKYETLYNNSSNIGDGFDCEN